MSVEYDEEGKWDEVVGPEEREESYVFRVSVESLNKN